MTLRYFEVEFQTLETKKEPQSPHMMRDEKMLFPLYEQLFLDAEKYRIIQQALAERLYRELHGDSK